VCRDKAALFQWVQGPPGNRSSRKQPGAEGIEGKPAFREAFQRRRCLVPVDNFYEWKRVAAGSRQHQTSCAPNFTIECR